MGGGGGGSHNIVPSSASPGTTALMFDGHVGFHLSPLCLGQRPAAALMLSSVFDVSLFNGSTSELRPKR